MCILKNGQNAKIEFSIIKSLPLMEVYNKMLTVSWDIVPSKTKVCEYLNASRFSPNTASTLHSLYQVLSLNIIHNSCEMLMVSTIPPALNTSLPTQCMIFYLTIKLLQFLIVYCWNRLQCLCAIMFKLMCPPLHCEFLLGFDFFFEHRVQS